MHQLLVRNFASLYLNLYAIQDMHFALATYFLIHVGYNSTLRFILSDWTERTLWDHILSSSNTHLSESETFFCHNLRELTNPPFTIYNMQIFHLKQNLDYGL